MTIVIRYLALATMIVLYSLMFIGGYVSAAGLGLTCPEWPLCPDGIMPSEEYLIEWVHRLVAAVTGLLVVTTMIISVINKNAGMKNIESKFKIGKLNLDFTDPDAIGYCGERPGDNRNDFFSGAIVNNYVKDYGLDRELPLLCAIPDDAKWWERIKK